jgi:hypothetical protein
MVNGEMVRPTRLLTQVPAMCAVINSYLREDFDGIYTYESLCRYMDRHYRRRPLIEWTRYYAVEPSSLEGAGGGGTSS